LEEEPREPEESLEEFESPDIAADFEDYYQHLQEFDQLQEPPKVKHISRFFNAIRMWLNENPMPNDVAIVHPGGWLF
jgi:hypothetical protein